MRVRIDASKCTGHAQCAAAAPDVFELDEFGVAIPLDANVSPDHEAAARLGAGACPERAIDIID